MKKPFYFLPEITLLIFFGSVSTTHWLMYADLFAEHRTKEQIEEHKIIDSNIDKTKWNPKRKVLIVGFDGVQDKIFEEYINPHQLTNNFKYSFPIYTYESIFGWRTILKGSVTGDNFNTIYDMSFGAQNQKDIKSAYYFSWPELNPDQGSVIGQRGQDEFNLSKKITKIVETEKYIDKFSGTKAEAQEIMNEALLILKKQKAEVIKDLKNNFNLIFDYDCSYDNLMHWMGHKIEEVNLLKPQILKAFQDKLIDYLQVADENTLILAVTDHGRNLLNNGQHHHLVHPTAYNSWFYANRDLTILLGREPINLYDVKTIINKWMTKET